MSTSFSRIRRRHVMQPDRPGRHRLFALVAVLGLVVGAFGLTSCHPTSAHTALQLTVTDSASSNAPAANVTVSVSVYQPPRPGVVPIPAIVATGITDANGNVWFTHDQLPADDYVVSFGSGPSKTWYPDATTLSAATPVTVTDTSPTQISGSLAVDDGYILGMASNSAGDGIAGVTVTAYDAATGKQVGSTRTESVGTVGSYNLYPGDMQGGQLYRGQFYKIGFTKAGYATQYVGAGGSVAYSLADAVLVAAGQQHHVQINATMQPESTITGTVKPDGTDPVAGAIVLAFVAGTNHLATYATTAADGTFTLHGLSGTGYKLEIVDPGGTYAPMVLGAGTGPGATPGPANGSTFSLQAGGDLSVGTISLTVGTDCAAAQAGTSTDLDYADLHNCDLANADLSSVGLAHADLSGANLSHATLPDNGQSPNPSLTGAKLRDTNLSQAQVASSFDAPNFIDADLSAADLSSAKMLGADFNAATLVGANLSHTDLSGAHIDGANVSGADLSATTFLHTTTYDLTWSTPPTIPSGYRLIGTNIVGAGVLLQGVDLSGQDLSGMNLADVWIYDVDFSNADLTNTTLTNTYWNAADLSGADLSGATLTVGYSTGLTSNASTVLPTGWEIVDGSFVQN